MFSAIQLSETSVLCSYCLYGSSVFGVFPLYVFFLNGRAILKRLFASDKSIGGEGWYIEEAAAFREVAFHQLPCRVTEGKLFNCCTGGFGGCFWFGFFWYSLSFPSFFSLSFFPFFKKKKKSFSSELWLLPQRLL